MANDRKTTLTLTDLPPSPSLMVNPLVDAALILQHSNIQMLGAQFYRGSKRTNEEWKYKQMDVRFNALHQPLVDGGVCN